MAHVVNKPERWAAAALGLLEAEIVLAGLVSRDSGANFVGAKNDTVNIPRPSLLAGTVEQLRAMDGAGYSISTEELNESSLSVALTDHVYSAVDLTDAQLSLDIGNFGAQVLMPQMKSIATRIEFMLAKKFNALPATDVEISADVSVVRRAIVAMRKTLNSRDVPSDGRILAVGVDVEEFLLNDPQFIRVDQSGSTGALRDAEIGRIAGFRVVVSNRIDAARMVAFHPSAYTLVTRAPRVPDGAVSGSSETYRGVALRAIKDYNSAKACDRSFLNTFVGIGETTDPSITYDADGVPTIGAAGMLRATAAVLVEPAAGG